MPLAFQSCQDPVAPRPFAGILVGSLPEDGGGDAHALATQLAALCDADLVLADRVDHLAGAAPPHADFATRRSHRMLI